LVANGVWNRLAEISDDSTITRARLDHFAGFIGSIILENITGCGKHFPAAAISKHSEWA
jgi:hypothetical protein